MQKKQLIYFRMDLKELLNKWELSKHYNELYILLGRKKQAYVRLKYQSKLAHSNKEYVKEWNSLLSLDKIVKITIETTKEPIKIESNEMLKVFQKALKEYQKTTTPYLMLDLLRIENPRKASYRLLFLREFRELFQFMRIETELNNSKIYHFIAEFMELTGFEWGDITLPKFYIKDHLFN